MSVIDGEKDWMLEGWRDPRAKRAHIRVGQSRCSIKWPCPNIVVPAKAGTTI
jgi:hypothetical protein